MRYIVNVTEMLMSEVIVEADSLQMAEEKAIDAVWGGAQGGGVTRHHDSDTQAEGELLQSEYQEGGEYYNEQVVE